MQLDLPEVVAEVKFAFERYEKALCRTMWPCWTRCSTTMRAPSATAAQRILYGYEEIKSFRAARSPAGLARTLSKTVISTFGRDFAVASTLFHRPATPGKVGRQMQTWVRFPQGWRIVAAHVSVIDA